MKMIDANVFVYSVGKDHPYKEASTDVLDLVKGGGVEANISVEVLQELLHIFRARNRLDIGLNLFDYLRGMFPAPFEINMETASLARDILEKYPRLQSRDAFHAAVVLEHDLEGIISADRAFDMIDGLTRFDPKELAA